MSLESDIVSCFVVLIRVQHVHLTLIFTRSCLSGGIVAADGTHHAPSPCGSDSCIEIHRSPFRGSCPETAPRRPTTVHRHAFQSTSL